MQLLVRNCYASANWIMKKRLMRCCSNQDIIIGYFALKDFAHMFAFPSQVRVSNVRNKEILHRSPQGDFFNTYITVI